MSKANTGVRVSSQAALYRDAPALAFLASFAVFFLCLSATLDLFATFQPGEPRLKEPLGRYLMTFVATPPLFLACRRSARKLVQGELSESLG